MIPTLFFYELVLVALAWLCLMRWWLWPHDPATRCLTQPQPTPPRKRSHDPTVCRADPQASRCPVCTSNHASPSTTAVASQPQASHQPTPPCGRHVAALLSLDVLSVSRRVVAGQSARQWPSSRRPLATMPVSRVPGLCFRASWHDLAWQASGGGADRPCAGVLGRGLGMRATARVFEVDPNTVLHWLVEAAEHLRAFSCDFLCDVHVKQLQLDELYAMLRDVKNGALSASEARQHMTG